MEKKNKLHIFMSSSGGVGTTKLATLFSEILDTEITDMSLTQGAKNYKGIETFFKTAEEGIGYKDINMNTQELASKIIASFDEAHETGVPLSLVVDTGNIMGISLLNFIKDRKNGEFYGALEETNTEVIIHPVISSLSYSSSVKILDHVEELVPSHFENIVISVWVNFYHATHSSPKAKDFISNLSQKKFPSFKRKELFVGEHSPLIKKSIEQHFKETTFKHLSENRPQECDTFICFGNIRQYFDEMKVIIMDEFGSEKGTSSEESSDNLSEN